MVIGVIGGVGAGKSTVLEVLKNDFQYEVYRMDDLAKALYQPGTRVYDAILALLGPDVAREDGSLDFTKFAERLYRDRVLRKKVDHIVHPEVFREVDRLIAKARKKEHDITVETALPNQHFIDECDEVWFIYTEAEVRIQRLMESRGYTRGKAEDMIHSQMDDAEYFELSTLVIDNSGTREETVHEIYEHCKRFQR
jgi:dephospho-CoA kinase